MSEKISRKINWKWLVLFIIILGAGIFARTWEYGLLPEGLHRDEVGHAYDGYSVYQYRYDRNGVRNPLMFVSWGDGQTVLYPYLAIPSMAVFGLTPMGIRLPNLIAGILIIPLMYLIGRKIQGQRLGFLLMFLMAISPWNIMGSRWGLEPYFLPFLFSLGFLFTLLSTPRNFWFTAAAFVFGLCIYIYSTAFAAVPVFFILASILLISTRRVSWAKLIFSAVLLLLMAAPIILYLYINTNNLPSIQLWKFTIPALPLESRVEELVALFSPEMFAKFVLNISQFGSVVWNQSDNWLRNALPVFGFGYPLAPALGIAGILLVFFKKNLPGRFEMVLVTLWVLASSAIGVLQLVNLTRISLIFTPLMILGAVFILWIAGKSKYILPPVIAAYIVLFGAFTSVYHSDLYHQYADVEFNTGLIEAIQFVSEETALPVCLDQTTLNVYVYVLFAENPDPLKVVRLRKGYVNPWNPFEADKPFGRYATIPDNCPVELDNAYVIRKGETPLEDTSTFRVYDFNIFDVLIPPGK